MKQWITTNLKEKILDKTLDFKIEFSPIVHKAISLHTAVSNLLLDVASTDKQLYIAYSGGYDSEYILKMCIENKIDATPIIVKLNGNEIETEFATKFCKNQNLSPIVLNVSDEDIVRMWYNRIYSQIAGRGIFWVPTVAAIEYAEANSGILIGGEGDPLSDGHIDNVDIPMEDAVHLGEWDFYIRDIFGISNGAIFCQTNQVFYAYLKDIDKSLSIQKAKAKLYDLEFRKKMVNSYSVGLFKALNNMTTNKSKHSIELGSFDTMLAFLERWVK